MLAGLLYEDSLPFFKDMDHSCGLYPDDVLEILEGLGLPSREIRTLSRRQPALVAVEWRDMPGGHYLVWDPRRKQFLDPLYGLLPRKDVLAHCRIEHIWSVGGRNMRQLVKARLAKVLAKELFEPFGSPAIGLGRQDGKFTIEVRFTEEPLPEARLITAVKGIPVRIWVVGKIKAQEE